MFIHERLSLRAFLFLCLGVFSLLFYNSTARAYTEKDVTGGGTIEGTVKWAGAIPEVSFFPIQKDIEVCGKEPKLSPRLIISNDGGVKNTVLYLANIQEGKKMAELSSTLTLDQVECQYEPHIYIVPVGAEFVMTTSDDTLHNIHMYGAANYNLAFPVKGQKIAKKLRKAGVVDVVCDAGHYWMSAEVHVVEHPYYTVTDKDGKFKLENVPPGTYKLTAWHEGWKEKEKKEKEGKIDKIMFSDPVIIEKEVKVTENAVLTVELEISDK